MVFFNESLDEKCFKGLINEFYFYNCFIKFNNIYLYL